jgi:hypothetical protein
VQSTLRWVLVLSVLSAPAWAFPWMVKKGYGSCAACHVDPSGAGQLTQYGRAQADVLVRWRTTPRAEDEEVPKSANFLWFLELPEVLNLSGNFRNGLMVRPGRTPAVLPVPMALDLYGTVNVGPVVAHVTTGVGLRGAQLAAIAPVCDPSNPPVAGDSPFAPCGVQWLAREFWAGVKLADEAVMIRAGRMNLPFGLRNNEHITYARALTRTDINVGQQVGISASYNSETVRGEIMGILGNFQVSPDVYRERGYSAFAEYALAHNAYLGISSLITGTGADLSTGTPATRHAHGVFARFAPLERLALLAEVDFLAFQTKGQLDRLGFAALLQADFDLMQGLHLMGTFEGAHTGSGERGPSLGGWASLAWYPLPHLEVRVDNILRRRSVPGAAASFEYTLLLMLHVFL